MKRAITFGALGALALTALLVADGGAPVADAAMAGNRDAVKASADVNAPTANGTTPLMLAAASGNARAVEALLAGGANVNARESVRGLTAAMFAAAANRAEVLALLASTGADLAATSKVTDL